jgi:sodium-dependent dicarboxylate transporter 2/3/5
VNASGLALWLGESLLPLSQYGLLLLILAVTFTVVYLTELTSNLATTATFLPIVAALALQLDISPLILCIPVALAASCAFMLPVATAPNAIVYSSGLFAVADMAKAGMRLNVIAGFVVAIFCFVFLT